MRMGACIPQIFVPSNLFEGIKSVVYEEEAVFRIDNLRRVEL